MEDRPAPSRANRRGVIAGLAASDVPGDRAMAAVMEQAERDRAG